MGGRGEIRRYVGGDKATQQMSDVLPSFHSRLETGFDALAIPPWYSRRDRTPPYQATIRVEKIGL